MHNGRKSTTTCKPITVVPHYMLQHAHNNYKNTGTVSTYNRITLNRTYSFITTRIIMLKTISEDILFTN